MPDQTVASLRLLEGWWRGMLLVCVYVFVYARVRDCVRVRVFGRMSV